MIQLDIHLILHVYNIQISDIFHNCPEQEEEEQQSNPKDLGSNARGQKCTYATFLSLHSKLYIETDMLYFLLHRSQLQREKVHKIHRFSILEEAYIIISL